jgi:hypothetical protein
MSGGHPSSRQFTPRETVGGERVCLTIPPHFGSGTVFAKQPRKIPWLPAEIFD